MQTIKFSELIGQELKNKTRTIKDLARFIKRSSDYPSYSIFLGAGASVTSGIATGGQLVKQWRDEIFREVYTGAEDKIHNEEDIKNYLAKYQGVWYNPQNEYSSLFERKFDLPSQRRRFVESIVDNKIPSIGYYYLINLVNEKAFNTIFTTNFDDLLNEAFYHFSDTRPHVCAHDSSIGSLSVLSNRPKVIKLHGDYLYDDIKNTLRETESLENNTREKFIEFSKDYGLILVGYSGQDRSIMDVLNYLVQQEEYFKNGVYWCFRDDDEITHEVRKILWKDKVYCVRIEGFDELFAELNFELNLNVKQFTEKNTLKIDKCIQSFLKDERNLKNNEIIRKDLLKLKEKSNSQDISELITKLNESNHNKNISTIEFKKLLQIENLMLSANYNHTLLKIDEFLEESGFDLNNEELTTLQENLCFIKINCLQKMERSDNAHSFLDELINIDKLNLKFHHRKINLITDKLEKIKYLQKIKDFFPYNFVIRNDICLNFINFYNKNKQEMEFLDIDTCLKYINESISLDSSLDNQAIEIKFDLLNIKKEILKKKNFKQNEKILELLNTDIDSIINTSIQVNPIHRNSIDIYTKYITLKENLDNFQKNFPILLSYIDKCNNEKKKYIIKRASNILVADKFLENYTNNIILKRIASDFFNNEKFSKNIYFLKNKINYFQCINSDIEKIPSLIDRCIEHNSVAEICVSLSEFLSIRGMKNEINKLEIVMNNHLDELNPFSSSQLSKYISLTKYGAQSQQFIDYLENSKNLCEDIEDYITTYTYDLLLSKQYDKLISYVNDSSKIIENLDEDSKAIVKINYATAYKFIDSNLSKEILDDLEYIISKAISPTVTICCKSLKDNNSQALANMKNAIQSDFSLYYSFLKWPAINDELKEQLRNYISSNFKSNLLKAG